MYVQVKKKNVQQLSIFNLELLLCIEKTNRKYANLNKSGNWIIWNLKYKSMNEITFESYNVELSLFSGVIYLS